MVFVVGLISVVVFLFVVVLGVVRSVCLISLILWLLLVVCL